MSGHQDSVSFLRKDCEGLGVYGTRRRAGPGAAIVGRLRHAEEADDSADGPLHPPVGRLDGGNDGGHHGCERFLNLVNPQRVFFQVEVLERDLRQGVLRPGEFGLEVLLSLGGLVIPVLEYLVATR